MGRLQPSAGECNYQEPDRQLKEQFIHRLNNMEMLGEIIHKLTKVKVGNIVMSENVLSGVKKSRHKEQNQQ